jgi:hypothetical protein
LERLKAVSKTSVVEAACALALIAWRIYATPPPALWRDWIAIVAVYWLVCPRTPLSRGWSIVTFVAMALLLGIYSSGQVPWTLSNLRIWP